MNNRIYGYVRVSSKSQSSERQINTMHEKGVLDRDIHIDYCSGKNFERPAYKTLVEHLLRSGDLLYIDSLDRLGRNYDEVISEWKLITRKICADIVVLDQEHIFDSRRFKDMGDVGKLMEDQFLSLLSFVAEQELKKIKERQKQGIENAKRNGKHIGRPKVQFPSNWNEQYSKWRAEQITAKECMESLGLKRTSFYKLVKTYESN